MTIQMEYQTLTLQKEQYYNSKLAAMDLHLLYYI
jgi:hypothetical protein